MRSTIRLAPRRYSTVHDGHSERDDVDNLIRQNLIDTPFQVKSRSQSMNCDISKDLSFDRSEKDDVDSLLRENLIDTPFQVTTRSQSMNCDISKDLSFDRDDGKVYCPCVGFVHRTLSEELDALARSTEPNPPPCIGKMSHTLKDDFGSSSRSTHSHSDSNHRYGMESTLSVNDENRNPPSNIPEDTFTALSRLVLSPPSDSDRRHSLESTASVVDENQDTSPMPWSTTDNSEDDNDELEALLAEDWRNHYTFLFDNVRAPHQPHINTPMPSPPPLLSLSTMTSVHHLHNFGKQRNAYQINPQVYSKQDSPTFVPSRPPLLPKTANTSSRQSSTKLSTVKPSGKASVAWPSAPDTSLASDLSHPARLLPTTASSHTNMMGFSDTSKSIIGNGKGGEPNRAKKQLKAEQATLPSSPLKRTRKTNQKQPSHDPGAHPTGSSWSYLKDHYANQTSRRVAASAQQMTRQRHSNAGVDQQRRDTTQPGLYEQDMSRYGYTGRSAPAAFNHKACDTAQTQQYQHGMSRYGYTGRSNPTTFAQQTGGYTLPEQCQQDMSRYGYMSRSTPTVFEQHPGETTLAGKCKAEMSRYGYKGRTAPTHIHNQKKANPLTVTSNVDESRKVGAEGKHKERRLHVKRNATAAGLLSSRSTKSQSNDITATLHATKNKENYLPAHSLAQCGVTGDNVNHDRLKAVDAGLLSPTRPKTTSKKPKRVETPCPLPRTSPPKTRSATREDRAKAFFSSAKTGPSPIQLRSRK